MASTIPDAVGDAVADILKQGWTRVPTDSGNRWVFLATASPAETGVNEVTGVDRQPVALNTQQELEITGAPTGGTFTLSFGGDTTAAIDFDATADEVRDALMLLQSIVNPSGDYSTFGLVAVSGAGALPDNVLTIEFRMALGQANQALITADDALLTGGTTPTVTLTETVEGMSLWGAYVDANGEIERESGNDTLIAFGNADANETASHHGLRDAETSGLFVVAGALTTPISYTSGQPVQYAIGGLEIFGRGDQ